METEHRKSIQRNLVFIKGNISDVDDIVDHLIQMETLSMEQREKILVPNATSKDNCQRLIDYLIKAGPTAYENFIVALRETGNKYVIDQMNKDTCETKDSTTNTSVTKYGIKDRNKAELKLDISTDRICQQDLKEYINKTQSNVSHTKDGRGKFDEKLWNTLTTLQDEVRKNRQIMEEIRNSQQKLDERERKLQSEYQDVKGQLDSIKKKLSNKDKENAKLKTSLAELEGKLQIVVKERKTLDEEKTNVKQLYDNRKKTLKKRETELQLLEETKTSKVDNADDDSRKKQSAIMYDALEQFQDGEIETELTCPPLSAGIEKKDLIN